MEGAFEVCRPAHHGLPCHGSDSGAHLRIPCKIAISWNKRRALVVPAVELVDHDQFKAVGDRVDYTKISM